MELKLLRSFVVLAEELHFSRAAARLCIVQPALSQHIRALENELGVVLFDRDRHRVELSQAGRVFLVDAQATLDQAQRAIQRVKLADSGEIGTIRIGFISSLLPFYLPRLLRTLRLRYPLLEVELKDMPTPDQLKALREGRVDFGFLRLPIDDKQVEFQQVFDEPFVVAMHEGHALAALDVLTPADLAGHPAFILARRFAPGFHDGLIAAFKNGGLNLQVIQELGEFTTMLALVSAGMGIGILPGLALTTPPPHVCVRQLDLQGHRSSVGLAWCALDSALKRTFFSIATHDA
ncbi:MAG: LysR substrate-binding domain-containing protein [Rhodocyclaceae bacterium]